LPEGERLHEAIAEANRGGAGASRKRAGIVWDGTTLVALLLGAGARRESRVIAHGGGQPLLSAAQGKLLRITHDHSLVDEQMRLGTMTQEEADRSPFAA